MNTSFENYLQHSAEEVNATIASLFVGWFDETKDSLPQLTLPLTSFRGSVFGGKVLRGTLVKIGYNLANASESPEIVKVAAAFELLHSGLLVHDDIIDKSATRRGKPTLYRELGGKHYGIAQAICLGDLSMFFATRLISESNFETKRKNQALSAFTRMIEQTILGEMLDVELAFRTGDTLVEPEVLAMHKLKTARYTIVGPLTIGAILGGASEEQLSNISIFGEALGIAFQIQDDILGIFGDPLLTGKSATSDAEEHKITLLLSYSFDKASSAQKNILRKYYGKKNIIHTQHDLIKSVFIDTGALAYSQQKAKEYVVKAKSTIPLLTKRKDMGMFLNEFTDYLIMREK